MKILLNKTQLSAYNLLLRELKENLNSNIDLNTIDPQYHEYTKQTEQKFKDMSNALLPLLLPVSIQDNKNYIEIDNNTISLFVEYINFDIAQIEFNLKAMEQQWKEQTDKQLEEWKQKFAHANIQFKSLKAQAYQNLDKQLKIKKQQFDNIKNQYVSLKQILENNKK